MGCHFLLQEIFPTQGLNPGLPHYRHQGSVCVCVCVCIYKEFPWWLSGKESACRAGDLGLIPGSGRSTGGGHGNPLQYSCLENPMDRRAWRAAVCGVVQSRTQLNQLSSHSTACVYKYIGTEERDFLFFKTTDL